MSEVSAEGRIREAYIEMATHANYRPEATGDSAEIDLRGEAASYARRFVGEEQNAEFHIGISDYTTNRALVYTIEAARLLCGGVLGIDHALRLLEMALAEARMQRHNYPVLPEQMRGARLG